MNSTDEQTLRRFFEQRIVPVAEQLRARGVELLPPGSSDVSPRNGADSAWTVVDHSEPEFEEVEAGNCEQMLAERWNRERLPELAALAPELMALAREIEFEEDQSADVSPFLYVMY